MSRSIEGRIAKLEQFSEPERKYVFHVSDPSTREEEATIADAIGPIVIAPLPCATVEEWIAKHAPKGTMH